MVHFNSLHSEESIRYGYLLISGICPSPRTPRTTDVRSFRSPGRPETISVIVLGKLLGKGNAILKCFDEL